MENYFRKQKNEIKEETIRLGEDKLINDIGTALSELDYARDYFNLVYEPDEIDNAIYMEKIAEDRLSSLFRIAKMTLNKSQYK